MKCDLCETIATVHLTEIINDQMRELHLCEQCAKEKGPEMETHFGLQDMLTGLVDLEDDLEPQAKEQSKCKKCGMQYSDFKKTGRLGCGDCYDIFKNKLTPVLRRIHGSIRHVGKIPARTSSDVSDKLKIQQLKRKLQRAIEMEEFEEAARIRDQLRNVERGKI